MIFLLFWQHTYIYSVWPLIPAVSNLPPQACSTKWIIPMHMIVVHFFALNIPVAIISWLSPTRLSQSQQSLSLWSLRLSSLSTGSCVTDFHHFKCLPLHYHRHHRRHRQMMHVFLLFRLWAFESLAKQTAFLPGLSVRENVTLADPETNGSTNSSSVAVAILVPFFALIFAGLGFYLYKQRYEVYSGLSHFSTEPTFVAMVVYSCLKK